MGTPAVICLAAFSSCDAVALSVDASLLQDRTLSCAMSGNFLAYFLEIKLEKYDSKWLFMDVLPKLEHFEYF